MIDEIDTNSQFNEIPDGVHSFRVVDVRKVEKVKGMYSWTLSYENEEEGDIAFFGNAMGPILKVLGCKESDKKGIYLFDSSKVIGVPFKATVYSEPDKNDSTKMRKRMKDYDEVPF